VKIEFTQASRRHKIGRAHVMATTQPMSARTSAAVLEIIAVTTEADTLLVVYAMPYHFREGS